MSKGNLFLSQARGKVGSVVFSVLKGQQITRVYNSKPANPRSALQQAQRAKLANSTKFYKEAIENFYRFAFEDKLRHESDFNAFSRINIDRAAFLTKDKVDSLNFPAVGRFALSRGSLAVSPDCMFVSGNCGFSLGAIVTQKTIGGVSSALLTSYPALSVGDIVTLVLSVSGSSIFEDFGDPNTWIVRQFIIDPSNSVSLTEAGLSIFTDPLRSYLGFGGMNAETFGFFGVVFSRNTPNGLLVSNSDIFPSPAYGAYTDWALGAFSQAESARSYGATDEAILQGGLIPTLYTITSVSIAGDVVPAYSISRVAKGLSDNPTYTIAGKNLKDDAAGGKWTYAFYSNEDFEESGAVIRRPNFGTFKAVTSGSNIALSEGPQVGGVEGRSFFVMYYNGQPFVLVEIGK